MNNPTNDCEDPEIRNQQDPKSCEMPDSFWQQFVETNWEQRPRVLRLPFSTPIASCEEVLSALASAAEAGRANGRSRLRMFVDHAPLIGDTNHLLPTPGVETPEAYVQHTRSQLNGRDFELIGNAVQVHAPALWRRLRHFLRGLTDRVGLPSDHADLAAFLRTTQMTGFGMHKDNASVFVFVLKGRKRILAWPHEEFGQHPDDYCTLDYQDHLDRAVVLEGQPGDVIYWPSSYWHVGESDGDTSVTLHLALNMKADPGALAARALEKLLAQKPELSDTYPIDPAGPQASVMALPQEFAAGAAKLRQITDSKAIETILHREWLERVSASGFVETPPPQNGRALSPDDHVRGDPDFPILVAPLPDRSIACAAGGHSFTLPFHPALLDLVECLNSGAPMTVSALCTRFAESLGRDVLLDLLSQFHRLRALGIALL